MSTPTSEATFLLRDPSLLRSPQLERGTVLRLGNDRVISTARIIVAVLSLVALWIDPARPAPRDRLALIVFAAYLAGSLVVLALGARDRLRMTERTRVLLHIVDLVFVSLIVYFTEATVRAFFPFFIYLMLAAHLRWQWRGTLWTALAAAVAFVAIQSSVSVPMLGRTNLDDFLVRLSYIGVVGAVLAYIGWAQQAVRGRMSLATEWPVLSAPDRALPAYLEHAAAVLESRRLLLIWLPGAAPAAELASWFEGRVRVRRRDRDRVEGWFEPAAGEARAFHWDARSGRTTIVAAQGRRILDRPPLPARLLRAPGVRGVLGVPFTVRNGRGCLLAAQDGFGADEVVLAEIVASRFVAWANEMELVRERDEARERQRRFELASDLHDGVLQTLAGTSLQLQSLRRLIPASAPGATERIDELVEALAAEQRELRGRLERLAPDRGAAASVGLGQRFDMLARTIERRWQLATEWQLEPPHATVSAHIGHQLSRLILEAAANAAKHSRASRLSVRTLIEAGDIMLSICNDRPGAPGSAAAAFEPRMLRARLDRLGGTLRVRPEPERVVVEMTVPLSEVAHA
ncbi:MAG TPA: histidine kinase [Stellaceae bacterium]|nr:histidine kinase [Stellaceae bacterium]